MSKQELQHRAYKASGVSYEESLRVTQLVPCLYKRLGYELGCEKLSQLFYDAVFEDTENVWFLNIFVSSTKREAVENQYRFFVQIFGGPDLYKQKKGKYTRLVGRHAAYPIGHTAADHWVKHMEDAMNEHPNLNKLHKSNNDDNDNNNKNDNNNRMNENNIIETKEAMRLYFRYTAHYIVVAKEYMRDDQLSGGTGVDEGRVW
ncbi:hemoglobin [Fragilariopsis cylindrus CCMP1102]|uniref:Hemoglobin n=1 Tax=Fragilariopsis cylindrus CCMP1102 TaxID=635003 RepID=A0A1E7F8W1_9STRA|nr:hemoglobin [Fragilariopsis cylindrus CCMP1102]|eukprot:OEU14597.1 hemoglobin [Fragilariopsis cylindrus CCMP1102]